MSVLLVARGDCRLGTVRRDADGKIVKKSDAKFETNAEGGCVAICELDPETRGDRKSTRLNSSH